MARALLLAACLWPVVLAGALLQQTSDRPALLADVVYLAASSVCHQRPERSFRTAGIQWPVCARCAGLYLAAPAGALAGLRWRRRRLPPRHDRALTIVVLAAAPTVLTIAAEWFGASVTNGWRMMAALPAGCAIAALLVMVAPGRPGPIR